MKSVVIIGATSAIASHIARQHANRHDRIVLVGRNQQALDSQCADLKIRGGTQCFVVAADLVKTEQHQSLWEAVYQSAL